MDDGFRWRAAKPPVSPKRRREPKAQSPASANESPNGAPTPSFAENVEGQIRAYESAAKEAQARLGKLTRLEFSPIIPIERTPTAKERNDFARGVASV